MPAYLEPGELFNYSELLLGMPKAASFSVTIFDPNKNVRESYQRIFKPSKLNSLLSSAVRKHLDREREKNNKELVIDHSIKFDFLCYDTALIAF